MKLTNIQILQRRTIRAHKLDQWLCSRELVPCEDQLRDFAIRLKYLTDLLQVIIVKLVVRQVELIH